jgi:glycine/D-amino acid oxidase-like deaminating enzyme
MPQKLMLERVYWTAGQEDAEKDIRTNQAWRIPGRAQVVVVGAGYSGLSAALHLAQSGAEVVVVDQEPCLGQGASGRNGGMVLSGYPLDCTALIQRFGQTVAKELFAQSLRAVRGVEKLVRDGGIQCDFTPIEHITAAVHQRHNEWIAREQKSVALLTGISPRLLNIKQASHELGTEKYWGGLADPWAAALNPARFVHGLYRMAVNAGAKVHWQITVQGIDEKSARPQLRTNRGKIQAEHLVITTNGYACSPIPWLSRRVVPVESIIIATQKVPQEVMSTVLPQGNTVSDTKRVLHYFRKSPNGERLLFGGRPPIFWGSLQKKASALYRDMVSVFPQLAPYRPEYVWSGCVGFTRDHMPHAGLRKGQGYALGYCGHGIALATYLGRQVAKALCNGNNPPTLSFPNPSFSAFPLYRKRAWFVPPALAWYCLLDRFT